MLFGERLDILYPCMSRFSNLIFNESPALYSNHILQISLRVFHEDSYVTASSSLQLFVEGRQGMQFADESYPSS